MERCKVIPVDKQKGGVGKTTTTVNFGMSLCKKENVCCGLVGKNDDQQ